MEGQIITMKLDVPYCSQISDIENPEWRDRACTVTNLKMALEYYAKQNGAEPVPAIGALIEEGIEIHAYDPAVGWNHEGIVRLARNHGVNAYAQEFRSMTIDRRTGSSSPSRYSDKLLSEGVGKIAHHVEEGHPVIVSVLPGFGSNTQNHTVLVMGVARGDDDSVRSFSCLDPFQERSAGETPIEVPLERFTAFWRRLAIFVY
jgi:hypothetical protein